MHSIIIADKVGKMTLCRFHGRYDNRPDHTIGLSIVRRVKDNLRVFGPGRLGHEMPRPYDGKIKDQLFAGLKNKRQTSMRLVHHIGMQPYGVPTVINKGKFAKWLHA
jgi:hypothetical protein